MSINIKDVLQKHKKWLNSEPGGERANLCGANLCGADLCRANLCRADLCGANLCGADLCRANLCGANLCRADLCGANLCEANLCGADLCRANLCRADLCGANLCEANLRGADLCRANLCGANLCGAYWSIYTAFYPMQCPESGAYIGYKKAGGKIVKLQITEDAKRSSATSRKCRASKAVVLSITSMDGEGECDSVCSDYDKNFIYKVGEVVEVNNFCEDRWAECAAGIHHYITREEAIKHD